LLDVILRVESDLQGNHVLAKILSFANEHKIPIVAKGGVEISSPLKGGILLVKEVYDLDEAAKRECGIWDAEHSPQHDSYVTRDLAIKECVVFYNPSTMKMSASCESGWLGAGVQQSTWGGLDRADAEHQRAVAV
jgi:hypothetical protein